LFTSFGGQIIIHSESGTLHALDDANQARQVFNPRVLFPGIPGIEILRLAVLGQELFALMHLGDRYVVVNVNLDGSSEILSEFSTLSAPDFFNTRHMISDGQYLYGFLPNTNGTSFWVSDGTQEGTRLLPNVRVSNENLFLMLHPAEGVVAFPKEAYKEESAYRIFADRVEPFLILEDLPFTSLSVSSEAFDGVWLGEAFIWTQWERLFVLRADLSSELLAEFPDRRPGPVVVHNGRAFFAAADGLWATDGTHAGTERILDQRNLEEHSLVAFQDGLLVVEDLIDFRFDRILHYHNGQRSYVRQAGATRYFPESLPSKGFNLNNRYVYTHFDDSLKLSSVSAVDPDIPSATLLLETRLQVSPLNQNSQALFFDLESDFSILEAWVTDGTVAGTNPVDGNPPTSSELNSNSPRSYQTDTFFYRYFRDTNSLYRFSRDGMAEIIPTDVFANPNLGQILAGFPLSLVGRESNRLYDLADDASTWREIEIPTTGVIDLFHAYPGGWFASDIRSNNGNRLWRIDHQGSEMVLEFGERQVHHLAQKLAGNVLYFLVSAGQGAMVYGVSTLGGPAWKVGDFDFQFPLPEQIFIPTGRGEEVLVRTNGSLYLSDGTPNGTILVSESFVWFGAVDVIETRLGLRVIHETRNNLTLYEIPDGARQPSLLLSSSKGNFSGSWANLNGDLYFNYLHEEDDLPNISSVYRNTLHRLGPEDDQPEPVHFNGERLTSPQNMVVIDDNLYFMAGTVDAGVGVFKLKERQKIQAERWPYMPNIWMVQVPSRADTSYHWQVEGGRIWGASDSHFTMVAVESPEAFVEVTIENSDGSTTAEITLTREP
jgi:hypothetical protein